MQPPPPPGWSPPPPGWSPPPEPYGQPAGPPPPQYGQPTVPPQQYGQPTVPPQQQYGQAAPPPPQMWPPMVPPQAPRKGLPGWGIALIVVGAVVVVLCGVGVVIGIRSVGSAPKPTAMVLSCETDSIGLTTLSYQITNNDDKSHDYWVEGTVGGSPAIPDELLDVAPGAQATGELLGNGPGTDCEITKVDQR